METYSDAISKFKEKVEVKDLGSNKTSLRKIEIIDLPRKSPDFSTTNDTKDNALAKWMQNWIETGLKSGKLSAGDLLPKKITIANYVGVSVGTVQNAIRYIEDAGYVESKQRIGTIIRDYTKPVTQLRKQTSKRELAIIALKKLIIENNYKEGEPLPSSRELAKKLGSTSNTIRLVLEYFASINIIKSKGCRGNKANWTLINKPEISKEDLTVEVENISSDTLVNKVERDLKEYICENLKINSKLPSHFELADLLKVSIKTVHDAMKLLIKEGILVSKRGRYGTFVVKMPNEAMQSALESSIFASATEARLYNYEKVERHVKKLIKEKYKIGDKLPAMGDLSTELEISSNTVRKALQQLEKQHIVKFERGRYGGTFVINMPEEKESSAFTWLSVNPEHIKAYKK